MKYSSKDFANRYVHFKKDSQVWRSSNQFYFFKHVLTVKLYQTNLISLLIFCVNTALFSQQSRTPALIFEYVNNTDFKVCKSLCCMVKVSLKLDVM